MNLIEVNEQLKTDEQCLAYLRRRRWPDGVVRCPTCGCSKISEVTTTSQNKLKAARHIYECMERTCKQQFTATSGTLFHDSHLPLHKWFLAIALIGQAKKGMSARQLQRHLGIKSYKTAWYLGHRIRKAMEESGADFLSGVVEVDETHVSGKFDKRRNRDPWQTTVVAGMVERGGRVRTVKIPTASKKVLVGMVQNNVHPKSIVLTDEHRAYKSLSKIVRMHGVVCHKKEEWVRGKIHTNTIEGCWSLLKRAIVGSFHQISVKHLGRYLAEFDFKYNNRKVPTAFDDLSTKLLMGKPMPYKLLTAEVPSPF